MRLLPPGSSLANRRLEWSRFLDNAIVTFPTGERPFAGDSGHLFVRKARDLTGFDESQIMSPDKVVDQLNSGSTYSAVIFVDDFVGTGQQFRKTWHRKATCGESLETLYSRQPFPAFYCPLMCTEYARGQGLFELDGKVKFCPAYWLSDNYNLFASDSIWWPQSLQSGARDFIYKYSDRIGLPMTGGSDVTDWQGYNKLGLSIAFEHCCPDANNPALLHDIKWLDSTVEEKLMSDSSKIRGDLSKLFAYRAEWLKEKLFDLFTEPSYFPELDSDVPVVLMGGRGTGKTTVLRGLSYQGKFALSDKRPETVKGWENIGFYLRVDTNRVTAFSGPEVEPERWQKLFGHYANLILCDLVFEFIEWYEQSTSETCQLDEGVIKNISKSLCVEESTSVNSIRKNIESAIIEFESHINNITDGEPIKLSLQGAPIDLLVKSLASLTEFKGKTFSFLIDEFENLSDEQQKVLNTLIKHASDLHTFKIGVRELGWRCRTTLNAHEQLQSPADYRLIDIAGRLEANFSQFAERVCNARLAYLRKANPDEDIPESIASLFPALTHEEEAIKLGATVIAASIRDDLGGGSRDEIEYFESLTPLRQCFLKYRADSDNVSVPEIIQKAQSDSNWESKFSNNSYALLFTLHKRKRGIQKFLLWLEGVFFTGQYKCPLFN